jgi:hypothetical protein
MDANTQEVLMFLILAAVLAFGLFLVYKQNA